MTPRTEDELAEMVRAANAPLRIEGGGTRGMAARVEGEALSTARLSGISLYEPGALTLVAQAGTPLAEVEKALAQEGQRLAFEPMDHRGLLGSAGTPTIGGVVAGNVSGPRRIQLGACRDFLLGVRFVDGSGRVVKNGGRVMKNVTGYDLVKLMAGSHGTLGVLTEVSLKVLPAPATTGMLICEGLRDAPAVAALSAALGSPFEVTGAAHVPSPDGGAARTMIRIEGFPNSVGYRLEELRKLLTTHGDFAPLTDPEAVLSAWEAVRDVRAFAKALGNVWRLSVKPSDAPGIVASLKGVQAIYDWGGGLVWLCVPEGFDDTRIRAAVDARGGHATLVRGRSNLPAFHPAAGPTAALEAGLRARFDPRGRLNPGLMGACA